MAEKRKYNSNSLLDIKFKPNCKGYDCDQVDLVLDDIITDYKNFEKAYSEAKEYISELETQLHKLKEEIKQKDIELVKCRGRLDRIGNETRVTSENINLITRMRKLEEALYARGVDPSKIK